MLSGSILIVDDEASLLDFLSVLCAGEGLSVTTARSVREAPRCLRPTAMRALQLVCWSRRPSRSPP